MKILTFDIEDWFHILDNPETQSNESWEKFPSRLAQGVERILDLLEEKNVPATFFCLGWVADKFPHVIREIDSRGHHIGSHSYAHQLVYGQSRHEFREDLRRSLSTLQEITGKPINCYRAPGFSIKEENLWAFDILLDEGISIDSSLFPASRAHGGMPTLKISGPSVGLVRGQPIKLFPMNTRHILGRKLVFSGGGYFRLLPSSLIRRWFKMESYVMTYFHPRDFDEEQPMIPGLSRIRQFKSYVGIKGARKKLRMILSENQFTDIPTACSQIDWTKAPKIKLDSQV